jgi:hypothetical protein
MTMSQTFPYRVKVKKEKDGSVSWEYEVLAEHFEEFRLRESKVREYILNNLNNLEL